MAQIKRILVALAACGMLLGGCGQDGSDEPAKVAAKPAKRKADKREAPVAAPQAPVTESVAQRETERRAVEVMNWGMPAVNFDLMYQAMARETHGGFNEVVYWSRLSDWKNQTLTPNPDAIYLMPFLDARDGPVVIEIPPADDGVINGTIMDAWQAPLEDVGPAGVDKGKGGKYLFVPPGYVGTPPRDYIVLPSSTFHGYALLRSILKSGSGADVAKAVAYGKRIRVYPLAKAAENPGTSFRDASGVVFDATIPYDWRFFESLDRFVQRESWLPRDRVMIDLLRTLGIEQGRPFAPDDTMKATLDSGAALAHAMFESRFEVLFATPYFEGTRWALPATPRFLEAATSGFTDPASYPIDERGVMFTFAFFTPRHLGEGQFYLMTLRDRDGDPFSGAGIYRLTVPADAPVTQYWSATVYDRATHALVRNLRWGSRSSQTPELEKNPDGSVDLWFGATAPPGKESNWVPTVASGQFEVLFRFYGPTQALFDKTWRLPDIERVD